MLSKDEFFDWRSAMAQIDPLLLNYIEKSMMVDKGKSEVSLINKDNIEQNILQKYRKLIGGSYIMRSDLELPDDEQKIIRREMIANSEIEFSEFLYDIKIFKIYKISNRDIIAYQIEIFTLNDANVVYRYNYPMNFSADCHDPHTMIVDIMNLIEHPLKDYPEEKKKGRIKNNNLGSNKPSAYGSNVDNSMVAGGMGSVISSNKDVDESGSAIMSS